MADASRIAHLIYKGIHNKLTAQEKQELDAWTNESPQNREFMDNRATPEAIHILVKAYWSIKDHVIRRRLGIFPYARRAAVIRVLKREMPAAAIFLIAAFFLWNKIKAANPEFSSYRKAGVTQLQAMKQGVHRPLLTFGEDSVLYLDNAHEGLLLRKGIWKFIRQGSTQLALWMDEEPHLSKQLQDSILITLSIPAGKPWTLILPDRSTIELHPNSSFSFHLFPNDTAIRYRQVALRGEARLHVFSDREAPFIVETPVGEAGVLGTTFIIRNYDSQDAMEVILLSGKISVTNGKSKAILKKDGQMVTMGKQSEKPKLTEGPPRQDSVYQPSEIFDFSRETLPAALEEVRKHYGMVKVRIQPDVDTTVGKLSKGTMTKDLPLQDLLDMLATDDMKFVIQDQTILVYK